MSDKDIKIHTGFRLSRKNLQFIEKIGSSLGLNKTNALDLLITVLRNDPKALSNLISKAISE
ncbi:MAG: hypothetical protein HQ521_17720 [Bacteroidetes bacterium]|nr:hypothetical protein [Bacteroidota bacterium]